ncbi:glycosyl hydrolase family 28-related protein [Streptomyces sp. NPDC004610]|uniref:glycosyl hydrolase family 28-related protein n=1 Tax=unclassified Streptomyces TaxID=2593676 RepID=UPI0033A92560
MSPDLSTPRPAARRRASGRAAVVMTALVTAVTLGAPAPLAAAADPVMYPNGVGADLGPAPRTLGLGAAAGADPAGLRTGELDGRGYWGTDTAAGTSYLSFDLDDEYVANLPGDDLVVSVTYRDTGQGALTLRQGADGTDATLPLTGTGTWKTGAFDLTDADLTGGKDILRLAARDGDTVPDITVAAVRIGSVGASVTLGAAPEAAGITPRGGDSSSGLVTGEHDGRGYWQTNRAAPAPGVNFLYMNVDDTYLHHTSDKVFVSVDYLDSGNGRIALHYDSPGDELADKFKPSAVFTYGDTGTWKTHTFALDDAILTNRANGADFRIHNGGSGAELKVAEVRVAVAPGQLKPAQGLEALIDDAALTLHAAREGDRDGQYPEGAKAGLTAAVDAARRTAADENATEEDLRTALHTLDTALDAFHAKAVSTDLTDGATLTASSTATGSAPANAADNDARTLWTSGSDGTGEWLSADLGKARSVNEVRVAWASRYAARFAVQVSRDGRSFTTVAEGGGGDDKEFATRFDTTTARHVRLSLTGYAESGGNFTVGEFEIRALPAVEGDARLVTTRFPTETPVVADFDARSYGADTTGRKDATDAIQNALYDCRDAGGGTVWLPSGTYRVTDTLEIHSFCTLRGDRRDPDRGSGSYGTVVSADLPSGEDGPALFRVGGSAGVIGLTTYYPRQNAQDPIPYGHTFEIPGRAWSGNENYMMSTLSDLTLLNSYRGIGISTYRNDRGESASSGQVHESATLRNIKGTVLSEGVRAYNGADVGTWENITFSNAYWAKAPAAYRPPARAALDARTRAHATGLVLGDLEWDQFYRISLSDFRTGIHIVPGQRAAFTGGFIEADVRRTDVAVRAEDFDSRWGLSFASSTLEGSDFAISNGSQAYVKVTGTELTGATEGTVHRLSGAVPAYDQKPLPRPARAVLYDVTDAPFKAPAGNGVLPERDATAAVQRALDRAGRDGGGIVYLPAGWYRIDGHLRVPKGVELRGSSAVPNRDLLGASAGTVLMAFEGRGTTAPDTATALITLDGDRAGVRGLRVFHPENNPAAPGGLKPYPYTVRGDGTGTYVLDIGLTNSWNGIDLATHTNDDFTVRKLAGAYFSHGVSVGESDGGRIEGVLSNGNAVSRVGYALPDWVQEKNIFPQVIDVPMREQAQIVTVDGATGLTLLDVFGYGFHHGLVVDSGEVTAFNLGTDNLGGDGFTVRAGAGAEVTAVNVMRYNGTTLSGPARLINVMAISMAQHAVRATAAPADGGTVTIHGNETEPGRYEKGSRVTVSATPAAGHRFTGWTVNGADAGQDPELPLTVTENLDVTARFTAAAEEDARD